MARRGRTLPSGGASCISSRHLLAGFAPARTNRRCRSSVVEHSLGKGEVDSSILSGSTRKPQKSAVLSSVLPSWRWETEEEQRSLLALWPVENPWTTFARGSGRLEQAGKCNVQPPLRALEVSMLKGLRYGRRFYSRQSGGSRSSADVILPIVFDLVHPRSVVDVGCGVGTWLSAAHQLGAGTIIGYDGHHVQDNMMVDNAIRFRQVDLAADPWEIRDKVDLAMSLEVAEHVPPEAGERIVEQLCRGAPVVL